MNLDEYIGDMYRPSDYPELNGKEPEWVQAEREMFKGDSNNMQLNFIIRPSRQEFRRKTGQRGDA